jgi:actin-related protein
MSVHRELAQHAEKQNQLYQQFLQLDELRESYIEEAVELCKQGKVFSTDKINEVTNQMNKMNIRFVPLRKHVTTEMVRAYVDKLTRG